MDLSCVFTRPINYAFFSFFEEKEKELDYICEAGAEAIITTAFGSCSLEKIVTILNKSSKQRKEFGFWLKI